jgi:hypothetical protein
MVNFPEQARTKGSTGYGPGLQIKNDITKLQQKIEKIIKVKIIEKIFEIEEINLSKESKYYTNVRFEKIM